MPPVNKRAISGGKLVKPILVNRGVRFACGAACKRGVEAPERSVSPRYA